MQFMPPGMGPQMGMPPQGPMGMRPPLLGAAPPGFMPQRQMGPGPPNRFGPPGMVNTVFNNCCQFSLLSLVIWTWDLSLLVSSWLKGACYCNIMAESKDRFCMVFVKYLWTARLGALTGQ